MYYAQLKDGVVTAVTETSGVIESQDMIEIEGFETNLLGKRYDEVTGEFIYVPPAPIRVLRKGDYLQRFTATERIAIRNYAKIDDAAADYVEMIAEMDTVDLGSEFIVDNLTAFETAGKLAAGRAEAIRA